MGVEIEKKMQAINNARDNANNAALLRRWQEEEKTTTLKS